LNNLLSAVSGQFGKALIFGTLLPVIVFVLLARIFVIPLLPAGLQAFEAFESLDPEWKLAATSFLTLVLTGLLLNLNIPIIRFYEGYPWKESWIGGWWLKRARARFDALQARWRGMRTLIYVSEPPATYEASQAEIVERWREIGLAVNRELPSQRDLVLPTRLGNVIRSFESYPDVQYGMDSIVLWPRLIAVIDKEYAAAIDESKAAVDFMLNSAVLSAVLSVAILLSGLLHPVPLAVAGWTSIWLIEIAVFVALSYGFYLLSIGRASAWGEVVKGAFDLYRGALLGKLGYEQVPATRAEERLLWEDLSVQILYGDSPRVQLPPYSSPGLSVRCEPPYLRLEAGRGVTQTMKAGKMVVTVRVAHPDRSGRTAMNVLVTDTLPEGFDYVWNTAKVAGRKVAVSGSNPYVFAVGAMAPGSFLKLTYHASARNSQ
jgi:uncharacterized repeat protein (TIGR01451 family)